MNSWFNHDIDYQALGFRCGVEIHQQLNTSRKLFCHCPVGLTSATPDAFILRHMRPTLSEMGEYDGTALMEKKTRKEIIYEMFNDRVCTYEMDDTPPFLVNQDALEIGIKLALLFQCSVVDEAHVSRKQYLDGSIPTGFQRTILIGTDGWIPFRGRKIRITQINVEEDACREVSDRGHRIIFRTDRLSTPLVEVITGTDMFSPEEAGEVTYLLAETNRISGLVRRGIGTARQDVNVSVTGGSRVEIKGVEKIGLIPALTHYEALRQKALLDLKNELQRRRLSPLDFSYGSADITGILKRSKDFVGRSAVDKGGTVFAVSIPGFRGCLEWPLYPERTFADEIAGRVRVIACLDEMPNIGHDATRLGIKDRHWKSVIEALHAGENDAIVFTWGPRQDVETAIDEIVQRCREAAEGVPGETRQVMPNGWSTDFERILPGPDRMYPDTDHPPIGIDEDYVKKTRIQIPEFPWKRKERLREMGLSEQLTHELVVHPRFPTFERMAEISKDPRWAACTTAETLKHLKRKGYDVSSITDEQMVGLARLFALKRFYREGTSDVLKNVCRGPKTIEDAVSATIVEVSFDQIERVLTDLVKKNDDMSAERDKRQRYLMGLVMRKYRGAVPGNLVAERIRHLLGGNRPANAQRNTRA